MDSTIASAGVGGLTSLLFQAGKGEWNPWLTKAMALATGFSTGYATGGVDGGIVAASATLAAHGAFFANTRFGDALKISLLPRILTVISQVAANLAKAISNAEEPPKPPA